MQPTPFLRIRFRLTKEVPVRFLSHLDVLRMLERAVRRSGLPIRYSVGFHPQPKISIAAPLSVGLVSRAEYVDMEFSPGITEAMAEELLRKALPAGFSLLQAVLVPPKAPALMGQITAALYTANAAVPTAALPEMEHKISRLLEQETIRVERRTKKGKKIVNIRPLLENVKLEEGGTLSMLVACGSQGNLRPDDVLPLLGVDPLRQIIERQALYVMGKQGLIDPISAVSRTL